ncbi:hypothetical protein EJB06_30930 [Massilia atriviolacea]|uniref:Uncharacterized protein n=1 Tax=Massilia atriviolacea TaxID=2495579 RepID=A0A430HCC1_9BURK|nr:hypothetical protein [Massilia atriviolacea]RSZ55149.1 hypothetical protein EJB06_30930 [Massilia atriviolacea]
MAVNAELLLGTSKNYPVHSMWRTADSDAFLMIKTSLFADQKREAKLNKLGDALQVMEKQVDFAALADEVDRAVAASAAVVPRSQPN